MPKQPDPTKSVTNPRIAKLIELETAGRIKPEHQIELDTYRAQGLAPKRGDSGTVEQGKAASFYNRALGANADFERTGGGHGMGPRNIAQQTVHDIAPGLENTFINSQERQLADQAQRDFIAATLRYESGAAIPPSEFDNQYRIFFPMPGDGPEVLEQKARARQRAIEGLRLSAGPAADQADRRREGGDRGQDGRLAEAVATSAASKDAIGQDPDGPGAIQVSETGAQTFSTERDRAFAAKAQALFDRGGTKEQLDALAVSEGYPPYGDSLDEAIRARSRGGKVVILPHESGYKPPSVIGAAAASPVGAFATGAANALTGGYLDEIVGLTGGDAERAQQAKEVMRAAHPVADILGNVTGGALAMAGGEAALGRLGLSGATQASTLAPRLVGEDAAYGALYGSGEDNGNRLRGAIGGAAAGAAGGIAGRFGINAAANALAPTGGRLAALYAQGVRPTLGQRVVGAEGPISSVVGRAVNGAEEALQSIPGFGYAVAGARGRARDQFERGAFNSALGEIGDKLPDSMKLGTEPHAYMQDAFNRAYDEARSGMQFVPDQQYLADLNVFRNNIGSGVLTDAQVGQVRKILNNAVQSRLSAQGGRLDGEAYKAASSDISKAARDLSRTDPLVSEALNDYVAILDNAARRNSPAEAAARLDAADRGYAKAVRIEEAAAQRGANQDIGRFTPNQFDRAVQKTAGSVRSREYLRGDALMSDYANAGKSLSDRLPNSGTPERLFTGQLVAAGVGGGGAAATGTLPAAVGLGGVASLPYWAGVRNVTTELLAPRNAATPVGRGLTTLGRVVRERQRLGGYIAAPIGAEDFAAQ